MTAAATDSALAALAGRLDELERRNAVLTRQTRRLRLGLVGGAVLAGVGALLAADVVPKVAVSKTVETEQLIVRDATGAARIVVGMVDRGPAIKILAPDGTTEQAVLGVLDTGPGLAILDKAGRPRASFGMGTTGPILALLDAQQKDIAALQCDDRAGDAGLLLRNVEGRTQAALSIDRTAGVVGLQLFDSSGRMKTVYSLDARKATGLEIFDRNNRRRAALVLDQNVGIGFELRDEAGNLVVPARP